MLWLVLCLIIQFFSLAQSRREFVTRAVAVSAELKLELGRSVGRRWRRSSVFGIFRVCGRRKPESCGLFCGRTSGNEDEQRGRGGGGEASGGGRVALISGRLRACWLAGLLGTDKHCRECCVRRTSWATTSDTLPRHSKGQHVRRRAAGGTADVRRRDTTAGLQDRRTAHRPRGPCTAVWPLPAHCTCAWSVTRASRANNRSSTAGGAQQR